jgi:hypothetical protein
VPATALNHFNQDIARASAIVVHANTLPIGGPAEVLLRSDLLRSAWMFTVGAMDAYFCDAYTDLVAATIIAKSRQPAIVLPNWFYEIRFPVRAILEPYANNVNWRWRMAAREMMARENVLSLATIQTLFNKFFRDGHKFFSDLLDEWIRRPDAPRRLFGTTHSAYTAMDARAQDGARRQARSQMQERYGAIFQRRHDCSHNCDRPRVAPQPLHLAGTVRKVIQDIQFLVHRCDEHINAEFPEFLAGIGSTASTIRQAGY